jgi:hypothetical protein
VEDNTESPSGTGKAVLAPPLPLQDAKPATVIAATAPEMPRRLTLMHRKIEVFLLVIGFSIFSPAGEAEFFVVTMV